jgi:hypothetical protein
MAEIFTTNHRAKHYFAQPESGKNENNMPIGEALSSIPLAEMLACVEALRSSVRYHVDDPLIGCGCENCKTLAAYDAAMKKGQQ